VLVNNFNYAGFLVECLESALGQLREGDELVVVDDGSTDGSRAILEDYRERAGVRLVLQENGGQVAALVSGIAQVRNAVVAFLDSDDSFVPGYLDRLREIFGRNPDVNFVSSHPKILADDETAAASAQRMVMRMAFPAGPVGPTHWSTRCFAEYVGVPTSGISMRVSLARELAPMVDTMRNFEPRPSMLSRLAGYFGVSLPVSQFGADGVLVRYASLSGAAKYYDTRPGFHYRIHGNNRFGRLPYWQRLYQRHARVHALALKLEEQGYPSRPDTIELVREFSERAFPSSPRSRALLKFRYGMLIPRTRGSLTRKCRALLSLAFAGRPGSPSTEPG
jgi:glycosyltransferase involved in cell wall biosynthesis